MKVNDLSRLVRETMSDMPTDIVTALAAVDVFAYGKPDGKHIPSDARGVYIGTQLEGEEQETTDAKHPVGVILLYAGNIADEAEAMDVFLHEIGHALGLNEDEVAQL